VSEEGPAAAGWLEAIWIKRAHRGPMDAVPEAELVAGRGIRGNADQGRRRQVTVIERNAWQAALDEVGEAVAPSARRANLMVSGIELARTRGRVLRIGACRLEVGGETRPCYRMDEALEGLQDALRKDWRAGVFCAVLDDGVIRVGDEVRVET
jgi:MOSC domain-containing protein YiiM